MPLKKQTKVTRYLVMELHTLKRENYHPTFLNSIFSNLYLYFSIFILFTLYCRDSNSEDEHIWVEGWNARRMISKGSEVRYQHGYFQNFILITYSEIKFAIYPRASFVILYIN